MTLDWTDEQLTEAGLDKAKVLSLVRRLQRISKEIREMNLHIYGASGTGHLVHQSRPTHIVVLGGDLKPDFGCSIAHLGEGFDGGDW